MMVEGAAHPDCSEYAASPRVVIVDDHPLLALGLQSQLERVGVAADVIDPVGESDLVGEITSRNAVLVLVDLELPYENGGVGLTSDLVGAGQDVAVLTGSTNQMRWAQCLENGASALLTKDQPLDALINDIQQMLAGESVRPHQRLALVAEYRQQEAERAVRLRGFNELSERESQVLSGLMEGLKPDDLAERDFVSVQTIRTQIKSVLAKLGVSSQLAAVVRAHESGWKPQH